jgi:hypothetical protein
MVLSRLFRYPPAVLAEAALAATLPASARWLLRAEPSARSAPTADHDGHPAAAAASSQRPRFIASHGPPGLQVLPAALADETDASTALPALAGPGPLLPRHTQGPGPAARASL